MELLNLIANLNLAWLLMGVGSIRSAFENPRKIKCQWLFIGKILELSIYGPLGGGDRRSCEW